MCGIAGTIYNSDYLPGIVVTVDDIFALSEKIENGKEKCSLLLDIAWKYKSNVNFIRYCKIDSERKKIKLSHQKRN